MGRITWTGYCIYSNHHIFQINPHWFYSGGRPEFCDSFFQSAAIIFTGPDLPDGTTAPRPTGRAPLPLETSLPGVFAAGDVRWGSVKRVASAVGEGAVTIPQVHRYLETMRAASPAAGL